MVTPFKLQTLFTKDELLFIQQNFGLKRASILVLEESFQNAFEMYIIAALTEISDDYGDHKKLFIEAASYLGQARKLLDGLPHPSGKMAQRLSTMISTLNKLSEGDSSASERASRFMEKNLIRRLRDIWEANTSTPFHVGGDRTGRNPRDFLVYSFSIVARHYPDITWFKAVDHNLADLLIKRIKR